jgi:hypothetical protein
VILLAGTVNKETGSVMLIAFPVENVAEDATGMTGHENSSTGAERIFAVYVKWSAGHDPFLTCSVDFLTGHA